MSVFRMLTGYRNGSQFTVGRYPRDILSSP
jgi:hypothetical protein